MVTSLRARAIKEPFERVKVKSRIAINLAVNFFCANTNFQLNMFVLRIVIFRLNRTL